MVAGRLHFAEAPRIEPLVHLGLRHRSGRLRGLHLFQLLLVVCTQLGQRNREHLPVIAAERHLIVLHLPYPRLHLCALRAGEHSINLLLRITGKANGQQRRDAEKKCFHKMSGNRALLVRCCQDASSSQMNFADPSRHRMQAHRLPDNLFAGSRIPPPPRLLPGQHRIHQLLHPVTDRADRFNVAPVRARS